MLPLTYNTAARDTPYVLSFKDLHHMHCLTAVFIFGLTIFLKGEKKKKKIRSVPFPEGQTECINAYKAQM